MSPNARLRCGARGYRATRILGLFLSTGLLLGACGGEPAPESLGSEGDAIINGTADTAHPAVVAVMSNTASCSGTIIHVDAAQGIGHALSAAHCKTPVEIRQGIDLSNPDVVYSVIDSQNHPDYDGVIFDFKMVRFVGASASTPVIPAMTPAQDDLAPGTEVRHVGYGLAGPAPGSSNSLRHELVASLSGVSTHQLGYEQLDGGPCSGDSGGPQLTLDTELVAGVSSYGGQTCSSPGFSGRVSVAYDSFILPYINSGPLACDQCTQAATSGQGTCVPQVNNCFNDGDCSALVSCFNDCNNSACQQGCIDNHPPGWALYQQLLACVCDTGCVQECANEPICNGGTSSVAVTSASGAGGAGATSGAGANDDGWSSGDLEGEDYSGNTFGSSCSAASPTGSSGSGWLALLGMLGAAAMVRRRLHSATA